MARIVSERFDYGRNFCNKLWNACRFAFMNLEGYEPGPVSDSDLQMEDRWVLSRLATTANEVTTLLDRYQFDQATRARFVNSPGTNSATGIWKWSSRGCGTMRLARRLSGFWSS
ncbi:MAG: hypothetical protein R3C19_24505 [Planctomycetaceae bacterium]